MTDNLIFGTHITADGKSTFSGLYDENGDPVKIVLEKNGDNDILLVFAEDCNVEPYDEDPTDCGISDEEIDRVCQEQESCDDCPLRECCECEWEDDEDE